MVMGSHSEILPLHGGKRHQIWHEAPAIASMLLVRDTFTVTSNLNGETENLDRVPRT